jgi:hypothetical protein
MAQQNNSRLNMEIKQEHLTYLDRLRESGITNMWGSRSYVRSKFGLSKEYADNIVQYWMDNFDIDGTKLIREE